MSITFNETDTESRGDSSIFADFHKNEQKWKNLLTRGSSQLQ